MSDEIKRCYLKQHSLFGTLPDDQLKRISDVAKIKTFSKGETFCFNNIDTSRICFIVAGKMKLVASATSDYEIIKDILMEGDFFGDVGLENELNADEYAEALLRNTVVYCFSVSDFKNILQENPFLAMAYAGKVLGKLKKLEKRHADLVTASARSRLIRFIKSWASLEGNREGDKIVLKNYLTHQDIAGIISTSRQSVNILLNEFKSLGLMVYSRTRIELSDPARWLQ